MNISWSWEMMWIATCKWDFVLVFWLFPTTVEQADLKPVVMDWSRLCWCSWCWSMNSVWSIHIQSFHLQYFTSPTMRIRSDFVAALLAAGMPGSHVVSLHHVEPRVLLKLLALISSTRWKGQFPSTSLLHTIGGNIIRNCMFKSITYLCRYIRSILFGIFES